MAYNPKSLALKIPAPKKVSTTKLTLPHGSMKVSMGVKAQHVAKVNYGKTNKVSQKSSAQL